MSVNSLKSESLESSEYVLQGRSLSKIFVRLFATAEFDKGERNLKKVLNIFHLIFLGISCTIGSGSYSIIGLVAQKAGPGIVLTFILVGILCLFTCFPYAEFAAKIPSAGFSYSFAYATCGEFIAFLVGHSLHLYYIAASAICARCFCSYLASFLAMIGFGLPTWLYDLPFFGMHICILGALIVIFFCFLMLCGMEDSTTVNNIITILNVLTLAFAIIAGSFYIQPTKYYSNFFPYQAHGIFSGMGLTFVTFLGFEAVTCFTEEAKNPEHDIPMTLIIVVIVAIVINGSLALVMTGMAPLSVMNNNESLLAVFKQCPYWMSIIISIGSLAGLAASCSSALMGHPRIVFSMAFDRLLPKVFMQQNQKTRTLDAAIYVTCFLGVFITLIFDVSLIGNAISLTGLLVSATVDLGVVVARYNNEGYFAHRINRGCFIFYFVSILGGASLYFDWPIEITVVCGVINVGIYIFIALQPQLNIPINFACPCVPLIPMAGALTFLLVSSTVELKAWIVYLWYMLFGAIFYFFYGYKQSKLNPYRKTSNASTRMLTFPSEILANMTEEELITKHTVN